MKYMTTCCCGCCTVKTGTLVISILSVILDVTVIIVLSVYAALLDRGNVTATATITPNEVPDSTHIYETSREDAEAGARAYLIAAIVILVFRLLVDLLCVYGTSKDRRCFILPYLVLEGLNIAFLAVGVIAAFVGMTTVNSAVLAPAVTQLLIMLVALCLKLYYYGVALSHYHNLGCGEQDPTPSVSYKPLPVPSPDLKF